MGEKCERTAGKHGGRRREEGKGTGGGKEEVNRRPEEKGYSWTLLDTGSRGACWRGSHLPPPPPVAAVEPRPGHPVQ